VGLFFNPKILGTIFATNNQNFIPMKKIILMGMLIPFLAQAQTKTSIKNLVSKVSNANPATTTSNANIGAALKEALNKGVSNQVSKLTAMDGFLKNDAVKILLPAELQKVDNTLRQIGMGTLADEGIKVLNRAAETAVKESTPIFTKAISSITIADAKSILMGNQDAATAYLQKTTQTDLYAKFSPSVQASLSKVGADVVWSKIIAKYNAIPLISKVNPDLKGYVTDKTLEGVFKMISVEEKNIRTQPVFRTTSLLKSVFALQDGTK
jgi:hypothetical protein